MSHTLIGSPWQPPVATDNRLHRSPVILTMTVATDGRHICPVQSHKPFSPTSLSMIHPLPMLFPSSFHHILFLNSSLALTWCWLVSVLLNNISSDTRSSGSVIKVLFCLIRPWPFLKDFWFFLVYLNPFSSGFNSNRDKVIITYEFTTQIIKF